MTTQPSRRSRQGHDAAEETTTKRKKKNRSARKAASAKKLIGEMTRVQIARGLHGIIEEEIEDILNPDDGDDDDANPPLVDSSDEEEPSRWWKAETASGRVDEDLDSLDGSQIDDQDCVSGLTSVCLGRALPPVPASPSMHKGKKEELLTEENDQDDHHRSRGDRSPYRRAAKRNLDCPESCKQRCKRTLLQLDMQGVNFFDSETESELNVAADIPEFVEMDVAVDSGAGGNVLAAVDAPGHTVTESEGSRRGQKPKQLEGTSWPMTVRWSWK